MSITLSQLIFSLFFYSSPWKIFIGIDYEDFQEKMRVLSLVKTCDLADPSFLYRIYSLIIGRLPMFWNLLIFSYMSFLLIQEERRWGGCIYYRGQNHQFIGLWDLCKSTYPKNIS